MITNLGIAFLLTITGTPGVLLTNGEFESGQIVDEAFVPDGWTAPAENGGTAAGYESERCVTVMGFGSDEAAWLSDPMDVKAGEIYEFSFWGKASGNAQGIAVSGPTFCNHDYHLTNEWSRYSFVFRVPENETQARFRVGQWHAEGKFFFDNVRVQSVQAVHIRRGDMEIGVGERIHKQTYEACHRMSSEGANYCRFLQSMTTRFNSPRLLFDDSSNVVYRYEIPDNPFTKASIEINLNHHTGGVLSCLVRKEDGAWQEIGTLSEVSSKSFLIPDSLLPASAFEVKLEGKQDADGQCGFQVDRCDFKGELQTACEPIQGETRFVKVIQTDPALRVKILEIQTPMPLAEFSVPVEIENLSDRARYFELNIVYNNNIIPQLFSLEPKQKQVVDTGIIAVKTTGKHEFQIVVEEYLSTVDSTYHSIDRESPKRNIIYQAMFSINIPFLYAADYGRLIEQNETTAVWWCPGTYKVSKERPAPWWRKDTTVHLSAARGEYEPVQIVLRPKRSLSLLEINTYDLIGPSGAIIPKGNISVKQVEYVNVHRPSDAIGCLGDWPDPLPPVEDMLSLEKDRNYPFWITVLVPRAVSAGIYKGTIEFYSAEWRGVAPIQLRVYDFEIPKQFSLRTAFGFSPGYLRQYHHLETDEELDEVFDLYMQDFRDHRISPYDPTARNRIDYELKTNADGKEHFTFDFTDFDKAGKRYFDEFGFNGLRLGLVGMGSGTFHSRRKGRIGDHEQGTLEHERLFKEYASTIENHLREMGWLKHAYVYWFDEPSPKDYKFVKEGMDMIHRNAPGLTRFLTEQPEEEMFGTVDIWCPILDAFDPEICLERKKEGEKFWWYICTGPKEPYPGLFIDHHAIDFRIWLWMTHHYSVEGCLIWQSNYWTSSVAFPSPQLQDPYEDPMSYVTGYGRPAGYIGYWGNGDGRFIYPPRDWKQGKKIIAGPVDSIRWEILREGIEDYEYFTLVKQILKEKNLSPEERKTAQDLLTIPEEIIKSRTEFTKDPQLLYERRERLAEFIESVN